MIIPVSTTRRAFGESKISSTFFASEFMIFCIPLSVVFVELVGYPKFMFLLINLEVVATPVYWFFSYWYITSGGVGWGGDILPTI